MTVIFRYPEDNTSSINDPLLPWLRSIKKAIDGLSTADCHGTDLDELISNCIKIFKNDARYQNDVRFLKIWFLYMDSSPDFESIFRVMEQNKICRSNSLLYESYALFLEAKGKLADAFMAYQLGISRNAEPLERLKKAQALFRDRMSEIVNAGSHEKMGDGDSFQHSESGINPWSISVVKNLLQKMHSQISKYHGYHQSTKAYPGKVALSSLQKSARNKVIEIGGKKYQIKGCAGQGGFAQVFKAYVDRNPDEVVALKIQKPAFSWEFYMYRQLDERIPEKERSSFGFAHRLHLYSDYSIIVCDYLGHGTLQDAINSNVVIGGSMEEVLCIYYTTEMLSMLETLHSAGIIHGDFKPDNLLIRNARDDLTEDGFYDRTGPWLDQGLCLVDWGRGIDLSLFPDEIKFYGDCRTSGFRCVEMQEKKPWTFQVDIYGLCVIVHMMLHNSYMEVEKKASPDGGYIYKPKSYFKRNTAKTFYAASIFFEIRNQFGDFQPDLEQKQKYAAWKAADIRKALKEGRKPIPGPADGDKDLSILSSTSSGEYDLELSRSDPAIKPALEPDQLHQSYDEIPPSPSNNSPSLPSYPTASYPSHDFHPPPSTNRSENSTYSQPYHHQPYPREPQQHFPQNYPSHEISSPSYPNFQSYPSFTETSLPDAPSNHHSYHQGSDATYSTLSASTTTNYPSTTHYNSSSRNGTGLEAAPNSVQMYEYDSNYQPPPEKIAEAHKAARFAVGALAFDDISVAVDHLKKSLELLTNPSASQHKGDESGRRRKRGDDLDESLSRRTERRRRRGKATNGEATEARQGEARQGDGEATGAARDEQTESARDEQTKSARDEERVTRIDMSTSSNNDAGFFQNKRCKCGEKTGVYISELEKNPGKLYFKCANKACDYFVWGVAPTGNGSNIQKSEYDYDFARNNEVVNILEQLEANQRERLEAIKFMMLTTIVMVGFTMLVVLLK